MERDPLNLIIRVRQQVQDARPTEIGPLPPMYETILQMHARSYRLFRSLYPLINDNELESAFIVCRSLFEQTLRILEYADQSDEEHVQALLLAWSESSARKQRRNLDQMWEYIDEEDRAKMKDDIDANLLEIQSDISNLSVEERPKPGNLRCIAIRHGLGSDYATYLLMHDFVHGGHMSQFPFRKRHADGDGYVDILNRPREDLELRTQLAGLGSTLILLNFVATAALLGWDELPSIRETLGIVVTIRNSGTG